MASTRDRISTPWGGVRFSYGFRPFFLLAGCWACVSMIIWIAMLSGAVHIPSWFDPISWHAHEFLFGYLSAVIAGFLLTAVPNWTGRPPIVGGQLAGLAALWFIGRLAVFSSASLPIWAVVLADASFLVVLWAVVLREIVAGRKWANVPVLILIAVFVVANLLFHAEAIGTGPTTAAQGYGLRLAISAVLVLVVLIGGKIVPSFTRNYLVKLGTHKLPAPPMQRFDKAAILATVGVLVGWVMVPDANPTGVGLLVISCLHLIRLARWQGWAARTEPLVWVMHIAYLFVPLGALLVATAVFASEVIPLAAALHVWTAGALGLMTMAVMTRASLGHTGRDLHAGNATTLIYLALVVSVMSRIMADITPLVRDQWLNLSALCWVICFGGFLVVYGPMLLRSKKE